MGQTTTTSLVVSTTRRSLVTNIIDYADKAWSEADTAAYHRGDLRKDGLHLVGDGVYMWPAFGNVYAFPTSDGIVLYDTGDLNRYQQTRGYNAVINQRQFQAPTLQWPAEYRHPDCTFPTAPP
jgi:hypothetical protein